MKRVDGENSIAKGGQSDSIMNAAEANCKGASKQIFKKNRHSVPRWNPSSQLFILYLVASCDAGSLLVQIA
jgi:hypothetical protein